jgi:hypothetical protein
VEGNYFFFDNLEFEDKKWNYSTYNDRRFYTEVSKNSLRPNGKTLITNDPSGEPQGIPPGTYDIGDGFYDPTKRQICMYDGQFKRELNPGEEQWIIEKCRYEARKFDEGEDDHLDGSTDKIIREMIKLN